MVSKITIVILTLVIFIAFFLPWVGVETIVTSSISKILAKPTNPLITISGFQVPILANSSESKLIITIVQIFNPSIKNVDKKSYLIWLVPGFSIFFLLLMLFLGRNKWINLLVGIISIAIATGTTLKILTTNLDKAVVKVNLLIGVWLTLFCYFLFGLICLVNFFMVTFKKNNK
ncbi:MAG: hypothetical protein N2606_07370 [Candidatus Omnitrophica bacterium]|nr:hypothetical protein [Candidatus Omnitrophota bacterium]